VGPGTEGRDDSHGEECYEGVCASGAWKVCTPLLILSLKGRMWADLGGDVQACVGGEGRAGLFLT
jgi:hypothetical protein